MKTLIVKFKNNNLCDEDKYIINKKFREDISTFGYNVIVNFDSEDILDFYSNDSDIKAISFSEVESNNFLEKIK